MNPPYPSGRAVREAARSGTLVSQTSGLAPGFTQANLMILPADWAEEFRLFCERNPRPCPILEIVDQGSAEPRKFAPSADLRTDLPRYRIWRDGILVDEPTSIDSYWQDDFVSFLIGCSFTFESALIAAGLSVRHIELGCNVPMYKTSIPCEPAGRFFGNMVVSMRPFPPADAIRAVQITSDYPAVHGAPIHIGFPDQLGIQDLDRTDFGDPVPVRAGELPLFWACGVTPQSVVMAAKPPLAITHSPGCMFVTDVKDSDLIGS
ncbi:MAG: putative hydro-lyase [Planctomycetaceae bacterium]|nr:putative hydro-lyase [Planctomycetaceae bacterium]